MALAWAPLVKRLGAAGVQVCSYIRKANKQQQEHLQLQWQRRVSRTGWTELKQQPVGVAWPGEGNITGRGSDSSDKGARGQAAGASYSLSARGAELWRMVSCRTGILRPAMGAAPASSGMGRTVQQAAT